MEKPHIEIDASVAEIEKTLKEAGFLADWDYMRDSHFEGFVVKPNIETLEDALAFADRLEAECDHGCPKARTIRSRLNQDFWKEGTRFRSVLASTRRIHCWSHEAGSFHKER